MSCGLLSSFFVVLFFFLVFGKTCFGGKCDSDGLSCLSCTAYQRCSGGVPSGEIISCKNGDVCADDELKKCRAKLNCYELNECVRVGTFPDVMDDSKFFVCIHKGNFEFAKYDHTCKDGHYYDDDWADCLPRSGTSPSSFIPTSPSRRITGTPTPNFVCPGPGDYPNPSSCKSYYRCLKSGKAFLLPCSRLSFFDETARICTFIIPDRCKRLKHG